MVVPSEWEHFSVVAQRDGMVAPTRHVGNLVVLERRDRGRSRHILSATNAELPIIVTPEGPDLPAATQNHAVVVAARHLDNRRRVEWRRAEPRYHLGVGRLTAHAELAVVVLTPRIHSASLHGRDGVILAARQVLHRLALERLDPLRRARVRLVLAPKLPKVIAPEPEPRAAGDRHHGVVVGACHLLDAHSEQRRHQPRAGDLRDLPVA
mmetsp:Transcript_106453/g.308531  ORF Transcript_106453/g.308531 Transcript_106453/m.308531 type:complete len:209 (+) Transcript_106453:821-1447(+)